LRGNVSSFISGLHASSNCSVFQRGYQQNLKKRYKYFFWVHFSTHKFEFLQEIKKHGKPACLSLTDADSSNQWKPGGRQRPA
jgi:hypothetical protein